MFKRRKSGRRWGKAPVEAPEQPVDSGDVPDVPRDRAETAPEKYNSTLTDTSVSESAVKKKEKENDKKGFFPRLVEGLTKTRKSFVSNLYSVLRGRTIDPGLMEELEEVMISADMGMPATMKIIDEVNLKVKEEGIKNAEEIVGLIRESIRSSLEGLSSPLNSGAGDLNVIMVVGVNGAGKTTTIGKLANILKLEGKKVLLAAGDTFRAAAVEQLEIWAGRCGADMIKGSGGGDPSAVIYDSIQAARARRCDVIIADTAGRLHTKTNLMEELKKMKRVIGREVDNAPHEVLLVLDATTGQNALSQARVFNDVLGVTGIALTKLDGTARGGVVIGIAGELGIPIKFIGIGEKIDDLRPFDSAEFVDALFA